MWHSVSVKRYHQDSVLVMDNDPEVEAVMGQFQFQAHGLRDIPGVINNNSNHQA